MSFAAPAAPMGRFLLALLLVGCGNSTLGQSGGAGGGSGGSSGSGGSGGSGGGGGPFGDFPGSPVIDNGVPPGTTFGNMGAASGGPCMVEPEPETVFPRNWLRPRFRWNAVSGENIYELRLHAQNEINDLVVVTAQTSWTMPADMWQNLAAHIADQPITMTIRGGSLSGSTVTGIATGSSGPITIAPVTATGSIVYWTPNGGGALASMLRGFKVGEETVHTILTPAQAAGSQCIGCHSATPDGMFAAVTETPYPVGGQVVGQLGLRSVDGNATEPGFLTASARTLIARTPQEGPVFSRAHWAAGDRVALTMMQINNRSELVWTNLEATGQVQGTDWGVMTRTGDPGQVELPQWSHDGQSVIYASASSITLSVMINDGDVYIVPFANRQGGTAQKLMGASDPAFNEFYPTFSPDDRMVVFDRVQNGQSSYNDANSELYVVPATGGTPQRLAANDPVACSGKHSPGIYNSWPKWAPEAGNADGRVWYWLTFSSTRGQGTNPQLYITSVTVDEMGNVHSSPALYLWNQPSDQNNHTPAWDNFDIVAISR